MSTIPIIDVAPFLDGTDPEGVADAVGRACRDIGFFVVVGHGVDDALVAAARAEANAFFDLPEAEKLRCASSAYTGYSPLKGERLAYSLGEETPPDLKEGFTCARPPAMKGEGGYWEHELFPENRWPDDRPAFQASTERLYGVLGDLCAEIMAIFAAALDLPDRWFDPLIARHFSYLRFVHYPAPDGPVLDGQLRAGAHTDYGSLTLVHTETAPGGLQVLGVDGEWIDVPVVPGGFVVNLGDLMAEWTNDLWRSTLHRVVVPEPADWERSRRLSIVYFHEPDHDCVVSPLPTCVSDDRPARHAPITAGDHLAMKVARQVSV